MRAHGDTYLEICAGGTPPTSQLCIHNMHPSTTLRILTSPLVLHSSAGPSLHSLQDNKQLESPTSKPQHPRPTSCSMVVERFRDLRGLSPTVSAIFRGRGQVTGAASSCRMAQNVSLALRRHLQKTDAANMGARLLPKWRWAFFFGYQIETCIPQIPSASTIEPPPPCLWPRRMCPCPSGDVPYCWLGEPWATRCSS